MKSGEWVMGKEERIRGRRGGIGGEGIGVRGRLLGG